MCGWGGYHFNPLMLNVVVQGLKLLSTLWLDDDAHDAPLGFTLPKAH